MKKRGRRRRFETAAPPVDASPVLDETNSISGLPNDVFNALRIQMIEFAAGTADTLAFESMDRPQRKALRAMADCRGFTYESSGDRPVKPVVITRPPPALMPSPVEYGTVKLADQQRNDVATYIDKYPISEAEIDAHVTVSSEARGCESRQDQGRRSVPQIPPVPSPTNQVMQARRRLPAFQARSRVLDAVEKNTVTLITGGTGCGKTTQVPQFLLERASEEQRGVRIIVTQPRRLPAIAIAQRVAAERNETLGDTVGYHIRLEHKTSASTVLTYCTSGVLLRILAADPLASGCTHIILDEVHEREQNTDYLLIALKQALGTRRDLKIILMSATMEGNQAMFMDYFEQFNIFHVNIPSRLYPVTNFHLADVLALTGYKPPKEAVAKTIAFNDAFGIHDAWFGTESGGRHSNGEGGGQETLFRTEDWDLSGQSFDWNNNPSLVCYKADERPVEPASNQPDTFPDLLPNRPLTFCDAAIQALHDARAEIDKSDLAQCYRDAQRSRNDDVADRELAYIMIKYLMNSPIPGSILVFLPGAEDIQELEKKLTSDRFDGLRLCLVMLHSQLKTADQQRVFKPAGPGERKVILSTNIAEASLTIDDVVFVVDCGKAKENSYDYSSRISRLRTITIAKSNAEQRRGRAGRCRAGFCFRLFSVEEFDKMLPSQVAEIQRTAIHDVCLHAKMYAPERMSVKEFLQLAPEPPKDEAVDSSLRFLEELGALYTEKKEEARDGKKREPQLTQLGRLVARLPLDPQLARMLLFGYALRCFNPIVTLVALLSQRDLFNLAIGESKKSELNAVRDSFAHRDFSDHMMLLRAFKAFDDLSSDTNKQWGMCREKYLSASTLKMVDGVRRQLLMELRRIGFLYSTEDALDDVFLNTYSNKWPMVQAAIVAGSFPCIGLTKNGKMKKILTSVGTTELNRASNLKRQTTTYEKKREELEQYYISEPTIEFFVCQEFVEQFGVTMRTVSAVPSVTVALFAGPLRLAKDKLLAFFDSSSMDDTWEDTDGQFRVIAQSRDTLDLDNYLGVKGCIEDFKPLMQLRFKVMQYLLNVMMDPREISNGHSKILLSTLSKVLDLEHRAKGFNSVHDVYGGRPVDRGSSKGPTKSPGKAKRAGVRSYVVSASFYNATPMDEKERAEWVTPLRSSSDEVAGRGGSTTLDKQHSQPDQRRERTQSQVQQPQQGRGCNQQKQAEREALKEAVREITRGQAEPARNERSQLAPSPLPPMQQQLQQLQPARSDEKYSSPYRDNRQRERPEWTANTNRAEQQHRPFSKTPNRDWPRNQPREECNGKPPSRPSTQQQPQRTRSPTTNGHFPAAGRPAVCSVGNGGGAESSKTSTAAAASSSSSSGDSSRRAPPPPAAPSTPAAPSAPLPVPPLSEEQKPPTAPSTPAAPSVPSEASAPLPVPPLSEEQKPKVEQALQRPQSTPQLQQLQPFGLLATPFGFGYAPLLQPRGGLYDDMALGMGPLCPTMQQQQFGNYWPSEPFVGQAAGPPPVVDHLFNDYHEVQGGMLGTIPAEDYGGYQEYQPQEAVEQSQHGWDSHQQTPTENEVVQEAVKEILWQQTAKNAVKEIIRGQEEAHMVVKEILKGQEARDAVREIIRGQEEAHMVVKEILKGQEARDAVREIIQCQAETGRNWIDHVSRSDYYDSGPRAAATGGWDQKGGGYEGAYEGSYGRSRQDSQPIRGGLGFGPPSQRVPDEKWEYGSRYGNQERQQPYGHGGELRYQKQQPQSEEEVRSRQFSTEGGQSVRNWTGLSFVNTSYKTNGMHTDHNNGGGSHY